MPNPIMLDTFSLSQPIMLDDIVVHDSEDHPPSLHQVMHEREESPIDFGAPTEYSVEVIDPESNLSVDVPHEEDYLPEGVDVVVEKDGDPILGIDLGDLPGAPPGTTHPEPEEEDLVVEEKEEDSEEKDSKESSKENSNKKEDKWDWKSKGFGQFTLWVKDRFESVPSHSGYSEAGIERAQAYLEKLYSEISKAMRTDIDGELDSDSIVKMHEMIEEGIEKLQDRLGKIKDSKKSKRKKKSEEESSQLVKEAQKIFGIQNGVVITVPLFISALARTLVNGMVSSGKDIEHSYAELVKKYKLSDREKIELIQLLQDMGLPMIKDRAILPEEGFSPESTDNFDYAANYKA
jgi:hypothetical protein